MNTRLVLWGEIGTDRNALIAIHLNEATSRINIYAFPKDEATKDIQDALFVEWKNGGEFVFPENAIMWEVDANSDSILPENVKVDRPEIVLQSQHKWSKKLMSAKINQLLTDEIKLLHEKASVLAEYDQSLWENAKAQWDKITSYQKKNEITWEQTTVLKDKINTIFDALKAFKRIINENEDHANHLYVKELQKRIDDLQNKLIYEDQWKFIFEELKKIQAELKEAAIRWNQKRNLYDKVNAIFDDLRKYRATEVVGKMQNRILQLEKILHGVRDSIKRDSESYTMQIEKMMHYTRGKLTEEEIKSRFSFILDKTKEKETKAEGIQQTIEKIKKDVAKEKKQQEKREQTKAEKDEQQHNITQEKKQKKRSLNKKVSTEKPIEEVQPSSNEDTKPEVELIADESEDKGKTAETSEQNTTEEISQNVIQKEVVIIIEKPLE